MKFGKLITCCLMLFNTVISSEAAITPNSMNQTTPDNTLLSEVWLTQIQKPKISAYGSTNDFNFHSIKKILFHRYTGNTNTYTLGIDNIKIYNFTTGLYLTNFVTDMLTFSKLGPIPTNSSRTMDNQGFIAHANKKIANHLKIDFFAQFGSNKLNLKSTTETQRFGSLTGYSTYYANNNIGGIRLLYNYSFKQFFLQGDIDYFYIRFTQPDYFIAYPQQQIRVPKLTTNIGSYFENAKLSYFINDYFAPFITGSLIQVGSRSFSRPVISPGIAAASLPELFIAKNGYAYGGGLMLKFKKIIISTSYQHEDRKKIYTSNMYLLKLDWAFG